jgi:hypothetical protein
VRVARGSAGSDSTVAGSRNRVGTHTPIVVLDPLHSWPRGHLDVADASPPLRGKREQRRRGGSGQINPAGASKEPEPCKHKSSSRAVSSLAAATGHLRLRVYIMRRASCVAVLPARNE